MNMFHFTDLIDTSEWFTACSGNLWIVKVTRAINELSLLLDLLKERHTCELIS